MKPIDNNMTIMCSSQIMDFINANKNLEVVLGIFKNSCRRWEMFNLQNTMLTAYGIFENYSSLWITVNFPHFELICSKTAIGVLTPSVMNKSGVCGSRWVSSPTHPDTFFFVFVSVERYAWYKNVFYGAK